MPVSPEIQEAVRKVREMRDYIRADKEADKIRDQQLAEARDKQADAESKMAALQAKLDAIPVNRELNQEDKDALRMAFEEASEAQAAAVDAHDHAVEVHDELKDAVPANATMPEGSGSAPEQPQREPLPDDPSAPRPDPIPGTAGASAPLMPNLAFDPTGGAKVPPADGGQPQQAKPIETEGGFVVAGGGSTHRAPGSRPESPSSTLVPPTEPDQKGPASTADEAKSGLGDPAGNENLNAEGKVPQDAASQQAAAIDPEAEQARQDQLAKEKTAAEEEANKPRPDPMAGTGSNQPPASPAS